MMDKSRKKTRLKRVKPQKVLKSKIESRPSRVCVYKQTVEISQEDKPSNKTRSDSEVTRRKQPTTELVPAIVFITIDESNNKALSRRLRSG